VQPLGEVGLGLGRTAQREAGEERHLLALEEEACPPAGALTREPGRLDHRTPERRLEEPVPAQRPTELAQPALTQRHLDRGVGLEAVRSDLIRDPGRCLQAKPLERQTGAQVRPQRHPQAAEVSVVAQLQDVAATGDLARVPERPRVEHGARRQRADRDRDAGAGDPAFGLLPALFGLGEKRLLRQQEHRHVRDLARGEVRQQRAPDLGPGAEAVELLQREDGGDAQVDQADRIRRHEVNPPAAHGIEARHLIDQRPEDRIADVGLPT
jgi:hypothetical protein